MSSSKHEPGHEQLDHDWRIVAHDDGHIHAECPCGAQRLLAGTTVHGRLTVEADWVTPRLWNRVPLGD